MRVFLKPTGLHSRAMIRVANALHHYAPTTVRIVERIEDADLVVCHVIGHDSLSAIKAFNKPYAMIQYCLDSSAREVIDWRQDWQDAKLVWSYYNIVARLENENLLPDGTAMRFYHAPLGVDMAFLGRILTDYRNEPKRRGILTSGYVSHAASEAIQEVVFAAWMLGIPVTHLGPAQVAGMDETPLNSILGISDEGLAARYAESQWVSGLRHIEGFELPVIEGLCCGARPIVFDRPDMHQWYTGHAIFVPECSGSELVQHLHEVLGDEPEPVTRDERQWAAERFDWATIAQGFWERAL